MMKQLRLGFIATLCLCLLIVSACSNNAAPSNGETKAEGKAITLNAVSFLAKDDPLSATIQNWINQVEAATGNQVKINWRGGSDVIPIGEQVHAVQTGAIDIIFNYTGQYESQNREVSALPLSQLTPWEERESGFFDAMVESHAKIDMVYLGRWLSGSPRLWLNKSIDSVDHLKNMKIRATGNYTRFFNQLGITSTIIDPGEVYTALQTGIVEGFVFGGMLGPRKNGWTDSAKYVLDIPFWTQNCTILVNPTKWNKISKENQEKMVSATAEYEHDMVDYFNNESEVETAALKEAGVSFIKLPAADEQKFLDLAYNTEWEFLAKEIPAEVERLRGLSE